MFFRKSSPTQPLNSLPCTTKSQSFSKTKETHQWVKFTLFITLCLFLLYFMYPTTITTTTTTTDTTTTTTCDGSTPSFYIYNLPPRFNLDLLKNCENLNIYTNMCPHVKNNGLGQPLSKTSWYTTHQLLAEMIFHARLENHVCRTWDPNQAILFYIPFYGGLHASSMFREANHTLRDSLAVDLIDHVLSLPWWNRHNGKDHFISLGRTAWDFMRSSSGSDFGANILLNLPPVKNMSVLTIERQPWEGENQNGIPYPSYFHPKTKEEMLTWQNKMRQNDRPFLFSFIGGKRKGLGKAKIRDELFKQCNESSLCKLVDCGGGNSKCHQPMEVLSVMMESRFCLQAPGDSFTRRSTFDSILAGCIPVFFSPHTAYSQYHWYLPKEKNTYSVYIEEGGVGEKSNMIEEVLMGIKGVEVEKMREVVIGLIPRVSYAHPNGSDVGFNDAVDVALQGLFFFGYTSRTC
ncbi:putative exostosin [Medicago truncatula]|uniref:Putative exostosin n=1 Tax=Medicago truncatula TaxID=3880 RepID=A0A396JPN5_MEDTR|nr:probable xyloglucan galactosyltransferase GT17 [Medicago truncatula]RHN78238.1 putative exostosin [Medicago truncatula]